MKTPSSVVLFMLLFTGLAFSQSETYDSAAVAQIIDEGTNRSQVMDFIGDLCDVYGPRLNWSPAHRRAAAWAKDKLTSLGLANSHLEHFDPIGKGWTLKRYSAHVLGVQSWPLLSFPKAWSPSTGGAITKEVIHFDASTDSAVQTYRGKLKGKFVLLGDPVEVKAHFEPQALRETDSTLLELANADVTRNRSRRVEMTAARKAKALVDYSKLMLAVKEEAAAILTPSRGDGGTIFVQGATVPAHPDTPSVRRIGAWDPKSPKLLPQVAVAAEHYNRMIRMLKKNAPLKIEMNLDAEFTKADSGVNVIAEIPGTDLKDEIVLIGGHLDSWHGGTGATDDASGSAVCMEAMRILKKLDLKPRRTIRVALWGGEEQGLHGSKGYVKRHLGVRETDSDGQPGEVRLTPEGEKFCVYFNLDNGTGKIRGVFMQGNEAARPVFRSWLKPFKEMGAQTLTLSSTSGSDQQSFDGFDLPGFQFIQDEIEYGSRTWHSTMDVYERIQADDLKQASIIMAAFAYNAAMRDAQFPRRTKTPVPAQAAQGSNR